MENILESVELIDIYTGDGVEEGKKRITLRLVYRSKTHTLTKKEIDIVHNCIIKAVEQQFNTKIEKSKK